MTYELIFGVLLTALVLLVVAAAMIISYAIGKHGSPKAAFQAAFPIDEN